MDHSVSCESLERFARGIAAREENRLIVAHLLCGCRVCAEQLARLQCLPFGPEEVRQLEPEALVALQGGQLPWTGAISGVMAGPGPTPLTSF